MWYSYAHYVPYGAHTICIWYTYYTKLVLKRYIWYMSIILYRCGTLEKPIHYGTAMAAVVSILIELISVRNMPDCTYDLG